MILRRKSSNKNMQREIIVRSYDDYSIYLEVISMRKFKNRKDISGFFKDISDNRSIIFVKDKNLLYKYNSFEVVLTNEYSGEVENVKAGVNKFKLLINNKIIHQFQYKVEEQSLLTVEPFEYIDHEDFDWGLFLCNIINDDKRKKGVISAWTR